MFLAKKGIYRSGHPIPSLIESLEAARYTLIFTYSTRIVGFDPDFELVHEKAITFLKNVKAWLVKTKNTASATVENGITVPARLAPEADASLFSAAAYFFEAIQLAEKGDGEATYSALLQCYFHLGRANSAETSKERSSVGGKKNAKRYDEITNAVIGWWNEQPKGKFPSLAAAIKWVTPKIREYEAKETQEGSKPISFKSSTNASIDRLIQRWRKDDEGIRSAIGHAVAGEIRAGKKKSAKAPAVAAKKKSPRKIK